MPTPGEIDIAITAALDLIQTQADAIATELDLDPLPVPDIRKQVQQSWREHSANDAMLLLRFAAFLDDGAAAVVVVGEET